MARDTLATGVHDNLAVMLARSNQFAEVEKLERQTFDIHLRVIFSSEFLVARTWEPPHLS
jgi:hypothetical protein